MSTIPSALLSFDTETALIRPGVAAPELACATWQRACRVRGREPAGIEHWTKCGPLFRRWLEGSDLIVGHNVAFDMSVIGSHDPELVPAIFDAYDADRVTDTMLREKLIDIGTGKYRGSWRGPKWEKRNYALGDVAARRLKKYLDKDTYRLTYGHWRNFPLDEWPEGARAYALDDTRSTLDICIDQWNEPEAESLLVDEFRQARKAFWLQLCSAWGLRTVPAAVERLQKETHALRDEIQARLVAAGLVRADGTRNLKAAADYMIEVCTRKGIPLRRTDPSVTAPLGNISLDADACEAADDPVLEDYADFVTLGAVMNKDVKALAQGCVFPIHTRFDLAETGRVTSAKPNVQNWARSAAGVFCEECGHAMTSKCELHPKACTPFQGARECFAPRPGCVYITADVGQLELHTLAQACIFLLGRSKLAEALNAGKDPHTAMACMIMGIPYDRGVELNDGKNCTKQEHDEFDNVRQTCKVANFGFPGGLGPEKLVWFARKTYNVDLGKGHTRTDKACDRRLRQAKKRLAALGSDAWIPPGYKDFLESALITYLDTGHVNDKIFLADHYAAAAKAFRSIARPSMTQLLAEDAAIDLKESWISAWPEMKDYFKYINTLQNPATKKYDLTHLGSLRRRGGAEYTAACNSFFQGLGADAMALAGWLIARAQYVDRSSPLFGARTVNFPHDEFVAEVPDDEYASDAAEELGRLMREGGRRFMPDVPLKVKPMLTRVWCKGAKETRNAAGKLIPWEPKKAA